MKIAIVGAGISGPYLARLFGQEGIYPDVYDASNQDTFCGCRSCGWGAPIGIKKYLDDVDLDLNEYLIEPMFSMNFDGLEAKTPLCTINKTHAHPRFKYRNQAEKAESRAGRGRYL